MVTDVADGSCRMRGSALRNQAKRRWTRRRQRQRERQWLRRALLEDDLAESVSLPTRVEWPGFTMGGPWSAAHWVAGSVRRRGPVGAATLRKELRAATGWRTWDALDFEEVFVDAVAKAIELGAREKDEILWPRRLAWQLELMSNLGPGRTGIDGAVIWVSAGEFAAAERQPGPRVVVVLGEKISTERLDGASSIRLTDPPQVSGALPVGVRRKALSFVVLNRDVLLRYWHNEVDTRKMVEGVKRVRRCLPFANLVNF